MVFYFVGSNGIAAKEEAEKIRKPFAAVGATVGIRNFGYLQTVRLETPAGRFYNTRNKLCEYGSFYFGQFRIQFTNLLVLIRMLSSQ